jgi:CheY-like chemotaxis protein
MGEPPRVLVIDDDAGIRDLLDLALADAGYAVALAADGAAALRMLGQRLRLTVEQVKELQEHITAQARARFSPLLRLTGVKGLTAGVLAVVLGPGRRCRTDADLALYAGVAPLEVSSAGRVRHRLKV